MTTHWYIYRGLVIKKTCTTFIKSDAECRALVRRTVRGPEKLACGGARAVEGGGLKIRWARPCAGSTPAPRTLSRLGLGRRLRLGTTQNVEDRRCGHHVRNDDYQGCELEDLHGMFDPVVQNK